jgi:hypothetical protein
LARTRTQIREATLLVADLDGFVTALISLVNKTRSLVLALALLIFAVTHALR